MALPFFLNKERLHFASQLLAYQVVQLFPNVLLVGGGEHPLGFYYDFVFEQSLTEGLCELMEVELRALVKAELDVRFISMMRENGVGMLQHQGQPLLAERLAEDERNVIDLIQIGAAFYSPAPALAFSSTLDGGAIKLLKWGKAITLLSGEAVEVIRFVGTAQDSSQELKQFTKAYDRFLKKRDHRLLLPSLNLFLFEKDEESCRFTWMPRGVKLKEIIFDKMNSFFSLSDQKIVTPCLTDMGALRKSLTSEHAAFLSNSQRKSCVEEGVLGRGVNLESCWGLCLNPLFTTLQMTKRCTQGQLKKEMISSLHLIEQIITIFGFEGYWVSVLFSGSQPFSSKRGEGFSLFNQAKASKPLRYPVLPGFEEKEGSPAFALEFRMRDCLGREWVLSRVAVAMEKFPKVEEALLVCQLWESWERLVALLVEHHEGYLPFWLVPEQVRILPIGKSALEYAESVLYELQKKNIRVKLADHDSDLASRIHEAEKKKVPFILLIGEQEASKRELSLREAGRPKENRRIKLEAFIDQIELL